MANRRDGWRSYSSILKPLALWGGSFLWDADMRLEIIFRGSTAQFINEVRDLREIILEDYGARDVNTYTYLSYKPDDPWVRAFIQPDEEEAAKVVNIKAIALPDNQTRLDVWAPDEYWDELKPYWERLEEKIRPFLPKAKPPPQDSGHYHYPAEQRKKIVAEYREAKAKGEARNKDTWARVNYMISGRTLYNYQEEFPPET
jgi:hypothetical protein